MKYENVINKLIPADDLFWYEEDQEYKAISKNQLDEVILACVDQGITELDDITKVVNWVTLVNTGNILLKNFMYGNIEITGFDPSDDPCFGVKK